MDMDRTNASVNDLMNASVNIQAKDLPRGVQYSGGFIFWCHDDIHFESNEVGAECIEVKRGTSCTIYAYGRHVAYDIAVSGEDGSMAVINNQVLKNQELKNVGTRRFQWTPQHGDHKLTLCNKNNGDLEMVSDPETELTCRPKPCGNEVGYNILPWRLHPH